MRPVILNGIEDVVIRPDLADRSIFLNLQNIADDKRKAEKQFWSEFEAAHPRILGALLDGVAHGLRQASHHPARQDAAHGGLRLVERRLRDGILGSRNVHAGLWPEPR